jgi:gamma-glutamylcyclotransferase (GGCT)/AIG2-like uncharacterized protein YtfP
MPLYFAYGSNMNRAQMVRRCPQSRSVSRAVLDGFSLEFPRVCDEWGGGVAGIEPDEQATVEGVLWQISADDLASLDGYEGIDEGEYTRCRVNVTQPDGGSVEAWTYLAVAQAGAPFAPPPRYVQTMVTGAREHGLSPQWVARLESMAGE